MNTTYYLKQLSHEERKELIQGLGVTIWGGFRVGKDYYFNDGILHVESNHIPLTCGNDYHLQINDFEILLFMVNGNIIGISNEKKKFFYNYMEKFFGEVWRGGCKAYLNEKRTANQKKIITKLENELAENNAEIDEDLGLLN